MARIYLTAIVGIPHKHKIRLNRPKRFRVFHFVIAEDLRHTLTQTSHDNDTLEQVQAMFRRYMDVKGYAAVGVIVGLARAKSVP